MGAISTIVHPSGSKALVFYNTAENTVALEIRDTVVTKDDNDDDLKTDSVAATYEDSDANVTGLVTNPTSLVSLYLDASDTYLVRHYIQILTMTNPQSRLVFMESFKRTQRQKWLTDGSVF
jgi:hypothetical protein